METINKRVFVYFGSKALISNVEEGLNFIKKAGFEPSLQNIKTLRDCFSEKPSGYTDRNYFEMACPNIGRNRIFVYRALAESLEEHELILIQKQEVKNKIDKERKEIAFQDFMNNAYYKLNGWYEVTIDYNVVDFHKGGYKRKTLNGRVVADSIADAYQKGCREIEQKGGEFEESMQQSLITYVGMLTDEYLLNENQR